MGGIVVVPYGSLDEAAARAVASRLSAGDRERLDGLDEGAARRFLSGRLALLRAAARTGDASVSIDAACPDCGRSHGRPRAVGGSRPLHLSLTHAGTSAFAIAGAGAVGIDAEPEPTSRVRLAAIDELAPGRGDPLRRWTAIEAVLKADGRGLRVAPEAVRLRGRLAVLDDRRYGVRMRRIDGCVVAVATRQRDSDGSAV